MLLNANKASGISCFMRTATASISTLCSAKVEMIAELAAQANTLIAPSDDQHNLLCSATVEMIAELQLKLMQTILPVMISIN